MRTSRLMTVGCLLILAAPPLACRAHSSVSPDGVELPEGTYRLSMAPVVGTGQGGVGVTPMPNASKTLDMVIKVHVVGVKPSTTYLVQRAGEINRVNSADGICQRAAGLPPWSPSDPPPNGGLFPSFRVPDPAGPEVSFTTQRDGTGSLDFEYVHPTVVAGTVFDVVIRVVDKADAPSSELRSTCFTVTAK